MRLVVIADSSRPVAVEVGADVVERRIDLGADTGLSRPPGAVPTLWTVRSRAEGGAFDGTPAEASALLARHAGPTEIFDAERDVVPLLRAALGADVPILASLHGRRAIDLPREGVFAWKIARPVESPEDMGAVLDEARRLAADFSAGRGPAAFVVPYGPFGVGLRVVCAAIAEGAGIDPFVYGVANDADPAFLARVPHVPALSMLRDDLRLGEVSGRARLFGLVGRPPSRSPSPRIHNAVFRHMGLDAIYLPEVDVDADAAMRLPYDGWSITTPLKEAMVGRCDALDASTARAGAVNTIVRRDGRLTGDNTDVGAFELVVFHRARSAGTVGVVLGGGGFARAAIVALRAQGLPVRVFGRGRARATAAEFGVEFGGEIPDVRGDEAVVVNATPVGADGDLPDAWRRFAVSIAADTTVIDGPYAPGGQPGAFARAAFRGSRRTRAGGEFLAIQAALQAAVFTGLRPVATIATFALKARPSLVLVGPRGAGKTTVGRLVARTLGRPFVDTDEEIGRVAGRPAGRFLADEGESAFRALEARVCARALARRGAVIALGGGALETDATFARALRDAFVVHLVVSPIEAAARITADAVLRPRLTSEGDLVTECEQLARVRGPRFAGAHARVATGGRDPATVARRVERAWGISIARGN